MKQIRLSNSDKIGLVDDDVYEKVKDLTWRINKGYILRSVRLGYGRKDNPSTLFLHWSVLPRKKGYVIDHIHHAILDNRRENLRYATMGQNMTHSRIKVGISGYRGVRNNKGSWEMRVRLNRKTYSKGGFLTAKEAAIAYNELAAKLHGEFAMLNSV